MKKNMKWPAVIGEEDEGFGCCFWRKMSSAVFGRKEELGFFEEKF